LFDNVRALDPHWGAIEFHPASLVFREKLPSEIESYRTMLALLNGGAHVLSPMRGSAAGEREIFPQDFRAYDAMEGSTFEYELVWWLREWRARPAGSLYFPFGNTLVSSDDGWRAGGATVVKPQPGRLLLQAKDGVAQISSPHWDGIRLDYASTLRVEGAWPGAALIAQAQLSDGSTWEGAVNAPGALLHIPARPDRLLTQLTLSWRHTGSNPLALDSVAWTPQP
jgi:hypothetical protein